jgi:hypothetical protein
MAWGWVVHVVASADRIAAEDRSLTAFGASCASLAQRRL